MGFHEEIGKIAHGLFRIHGLFVATLCVLHAPSVEGMHRVFEVPGDGLFRGACRERSSRHLEFQLSHKQVLVNLP